MALSAPDPRKGEQLILVTDKLDADKHPSEPVRDRMERALGEAARLR